MPLARSPEYRLKWVTKYTFGHGVLKGLSVGTGVRYSDRYEIANGATGIFVPEETLFDAFAAYRTKFRKVPTTFQLNLTNLTDEVNDITRDDGFVARLSVTLSL
jgi:outer membrane receptor for monomeric catechols